MNKIEHHLLLSWLILIGLITFGLYLAWDQGILNLLYGSDKSKISYLISFIYLLIIGHGAIRVWYVSKQLNYSSQIVNDIKHHSSEKIFVHDEQVKFSNNQFLPNSITTEFIHDLVTRNNNQINKTNSENASETDLIDVYESRLKSPDEIGWFASDAMIKLGLLGTIIGFILMLSSVVNVTEFDVTTMQKILANMSSGMGTALYTTMAGLICSLLATAQYHMIERHIDELMNSIKHISQVHILPKLS